MASIRDKRQRNLLAGGSAGFYEALQPHLNRPIDKVEVPVLSIYILTEAAWPKGKLHPSIS